MHVQNIAPCFDNKAKRKETKKNCMNSYFHYVLISRPYLKRRVLSKKMCYKRQNKKMYYKRWTKKRLTKKQEQSNE